MHLKAVLSIISICSLSFLSFSQTQEGNNTTNSKAQSNNVSNDIMFEIVLADMINLPAEPFSVANAEFYLNTLENWIKANQNTYHAIINGNTSNLTKVTVTKRDFENFSSIKQSEIKQWTKSIERLFTTQQKYLPDNKKVFLLATYEYNYLKSLITK